MAPIAVSSPPKVTEQLKALAIDTPAQAAFDIRSYSNFDSTPATGTEFRTVSNDGKPILTVRDILGNDERLKALGRLVSERGVVFFRDTEITTDEQRDLVQGLGVQGGKPATSGLHVHPLTLPTQAEGDEITVVSNKFVFGKVFARDNSNILERRLGRDEWHQDITFEWVRAVYDRTKRRRRRGRMSRDQVAGG